MDFSTNLKRIRKEKGLTLKQLGDKLGCSPQLISQYELKKRTPKVETIIKIADALGVNEFELMAIPSEVFTKEIKKQARQDFFDLLYCVGFEIDTLDNDKYRVFSSRFNYSIIVTEIDLDVLNKSIMDYILYTAENYFNDLHDKHIKEKK